MAWAQVVNEVSETDPETAFFVGKLRDLLEENLEKIEYVELRMTRGGRGGYVPTGRAISIDENKEPGAPDEGAALLARWARTIHEEQGISRFQVKAYGGNKGGAAKVLFCQAINLAGVDGPGGSGDDKGERSSEVLEAMRILKDLAGDLHRNYKEANGETRLMTTEYLNLAKTAAENATVKVELAKLIHAENKEQRDHEYDLQRLEAVGRMGEKFAETAGPLLGQVVQEWARSKMNLDPATMAGPYAQRIATILGALDEDQKSKCAEILGEKAWDLVHAAAKASNDAEVANILQAFDQALGETHEQRVEKLKRVTAVIGLQHAAALSAILTEILGQT